MYDVLTLDKIKDLIKDKNSLCFVYDNIDDSSLGLSQHHATPAAFGKF